MSKMRKKKQQIQRAVNCRRWSINVHRGGGRGGGLGCWGRRKKGGAQKLTEQDSQVNVTESYGRKQFFSVVCRCSDLRLQRLTCNSIGAAFKDSHVEEEGELSKRHLLAQACAVFPTNPWIFGGAGPCKFMQCHNLLKFTPRSTLLCQSSWPARSLHRQLVGWLGYSVSSSGKRGHCRGDCLSTIAHYCWDNPTCPHRRSPKPQQPPAPAFPKPFSQCRMRKPRRFKGLAIRAG